ncbi:hypothetical protein [Tenacibaculum finnmarkense]|uniref:hypothetical protein n=1 Tax=Tenacibaculum finnmarkense TaxID=2781243 RepID=UPI001E55418A|nr:hypothetical protein [Tenacibaculum finnmarkense]
MKNKSEMKYYTLFLITMLSLSCNAQDETKFEYNNFEKQFLNYQPTQNSNTSKKDFDHGKMIISETKALLKGDPEDFYISDYYNILSAFLSLKESRENIMIVFQKFKDSDGSCSYFLRLEPKIKNPKYDIIRDDFEREIINCKSSTIQEVFDLEKYCISNNLDIKLVEIIQAIDSDDQKDRLNHGTQAKLDKKNQVLIDSLYRNYGTYIGKTLVGDKFKDVLWSVIQHSNPEMMTEYLPIIKKAVEQDELGVTPFKMLIDRLYGLKYGFQIFGTQQGFGFELASDKKRKEIELQYGIE